MPSHYDDVKPYVYDDRFDDDNAGFVDHQPHHDDGAHIDYDDYHNTVVRHLNDEPDPVDNLRRDFIDALAHDYDALADDADHVRVINTAKRLTAALRHPATGNR